MILVECDRRPLHTSHCDKTESHTVEILDNNLSDYGSCAKLCIKKQAAGCCLLMDGSGCGWVSGSKAIPGGADIAGTCLKGENYVTVS